jgi:plasmid maintenance system antidote protein VapI
MPTPHEDERAEETADGDAPELVDRIERVEARLRSGGWRTRPSRAAQDGRIKQRRTAAQPARVLLDQWILRARLTQAEAADRIGISRIKLNQYLHGIARPSLETAIRIEDTTGVAVRAWLIVEDAA